MARRADAVLPSTSALAALLLPFLVVASILLYLFPRSTDVLFAWTIEPGLTAMFLGSAYVGGIWFFVQVLRARRWSRVSRGFPAVLVFATLALVATVLHWDRFHFGHISFIAWASLYILSPLLIAAVMWSQRGADNGSPDTPDVTIPRAVRITLAAIGIVAAIAGLALFLQPALGAGWAWDLTPLTSRIVGAILTLPGMVNVLMLFDDRWSAFRRVVQAELVSLAFIVGALVFSGGDLQWQRPSAALFSLGMIAALGVYAGMYAWLERRVTAESSVRAGRPQ
ncbi:hypothetical protein [Marisediminicola senii]|uniref:hypothetical protein n=1 Tax=Marisediminicola senii TaxID=2711233 RepID=UPI0013EE1636|nr:hypothetical protein [Marisediminicola senii]